MMKYLLLGLSMLLSTQIFAGEYQCKVYCDGGSTWATVDASSASDAAQKIDPTPVANGICRAADLGNATSSSMSSSQCERK